MTDSQEKIVANRVPRSFVGKVVSDKRAKTVTVLAEKKVEQKKGAAK